MYDQLTRAQLSQLHEILYLIGQGLMDKMFDADLKTRIEVGGALWCQLRAEQETNTAQMGRVYTEIQRRDHEAETTRQAADADALTGVPMVCTACRKPVHRAIDNADRAMWLHDFPADGAQCQRGTDRIMVMVSAGNENVARNA